MKIIQHLKHFFMENPYSNPKFEETIQNILEERATGSSLRNGFECNNLEDYSKGETVWTPREKALFCCFMLKYPLVNEYDRSVFFENLLRQKLDFSENDFVFVLENHFSNANHWSRKWGLTLKQIEKYVESNKDLPLLLKVLESLRNRYGSTYTHDYTIKIEQKLDNIIFQLTYHNRYRSFGEMEDLKQRIS